MRANKAFSCWCQARECTLPKKPHCQHRSTSFSIVIPTLNEVGNIGRLADRLLELVDPAKTMIVVVDDGSTDGTQEIVRQTGENSDSVVLLSRHGKRGIFSAIQDGIALMDTQFVALMDADFSHPPEMIPRLLDAAQRDDIASASRYMKGGGIHAPLKRVLASRSLNGICRLALGLSATDVLGGFHCLRRENYERLEFKYPALWGEFDLELFFRAKKLGFSLKELPFVYIFRDFGVSKSVDFKYGLAYLRQMARLLIYG